MDVKLMMMMMRWCHDMSFIFLVLVGISRLGGEIVSHNTTDARYMVFTSVLPRQPCLVDTLKLADPHLESCSLDDLLVLDF